MRRRVRFTARRMFSGLYRIRELSPLRLRTKYLHDGFGDGTLAFEAPVH